LLQQEKSMLMHELSETTRLTTLLETQLRRSVYIKKYSLLSVFNSIIYLIKNMIPSYLWRSLILFNNWYIGFYNIVCVLLMISLY